MTTQSAYLDHTFSVSSCDIDVWGRLRPTTILSICQEAAYMHSSKMGFGFDRLMALNLTWVLSRVRVEIERLPLWRETITVRTWHKRQSGLFALRDYIFTDEQGEPIIKVTTSWLIINITTRRISRVDRVLRDDKQFTICNYNHDALATEAERIEIQGERVALPDHLVQYSDLDVNHHVNNTKYLEWACNNSPQQMIAESSLKSFSINFNHEAKFNEVIKLSAATPSAKSIVVEGSIENRSIFVSSFIYV